MLSRLVFVVLTTVFIPKVAHSAFSPGCDSFMKLYLQSSERSVWYKVNLSAEDRLLQSYLSVQEQHSRFTEAMEESKKAYLQFEVSCMLRSRSRPETCGKLLFKIGEFNHLIGSSLSQTDYLNRNLVPVEPTWRQLMFERQHSEAKNAVANFRRRRNLLVQELFRSCVPQGPAYSTETENNVEPDVQDAALHTIREQFKEAKTLDLSAIHHVKFKCQVIAADELDFAKVSENEAALMWVDFILQNDNWGWMLQSVGASKPVNLELSKASSRVDSHGRVLIEVVTVARDSRGLSPLSTHLPNRVVQAYWTCQP